MRKLLPAFGPLLLFLVTGCSAASRTSTIKEAAIRTASFTVHADAPRGAISPLLFGANVEWTENGNRILDEKLLTLRDQVLSELAPLHLAVLRFPGGILSDYYHWNDGIGPENRRPVRSNPMDGTRYPNTFGTDEFIALCRKLGIQPLITANAGTGTVEEATQWQQYFATHGLPVRYWEVGNEIYLAEPRKNASIPGNDQRIYKTASQYAAAFLEYSRALHAGAPGTLVGAIAGTYNTSKENRGWLDTVAAQDAGAMDFVALHNSFAPIIVGRYDFGDPGKRGDAYLAAYAHAGAVEEDIASVRATLQRAHSPAAARIAITEHFPLFGGGGSHDQLLAVLDQSRTMAAAAYIASLFHTFMRSGVWMANYNLAVSPWFGALVLDTQQGLVRSPVWHVFDLYRNHFGTELISLTADSPTYGTGDLGVVKARQHVPLLDAVASRDNNQHYYLAVINRHPSAALSASVAITGPGLTPVRSYTLSAPSPNAVNGASLSNTTLAGESDSIRIKESAVIANALARYSFPPSSITVIEWTQQAQSKQLRNNGVNQ